MARYRKVDTRMWGTANSGSMNPNVSTGQDESVRAGSLLREAAANLGQGKLLALRAARLLDPVNRRKIETIAAHLQQLIAALDEASHVHRTRKPVILVAAR